MIAFQEVSDSVTTYAPSLNSKEHVAFSDFIWQQVRDDDIYDVNLANEWARFRDSQHPFLDHGRICYLIPLKAKNIKEKDKIT